MWPIHSGIIMLRSWIYTGPNRTYLKLVNSIVWHISFTELFLGSPLAFSWEGNHEVSNEKQNKNFLLSRTFFLSQTKFHNNSKQLCIAPLILTACVCSQNYVLHWPWPNALHERVTWFKYYPCSQSFVVSSLSNETGAVYFPAKSSPSWPQICTCHISSIVWCHGADKSDSQAAFKSFFGSTCCQSALWGMDSAQVLGKQTCKTKLPIPIPSFICDLGDVDRFV